MKKIFLSALSIVIVAGAFLFVQSCTKEKDNSFVFYATIQQYTKEGKAHIETSNLGNAYTCWDAGDQVKMYLNVGTLRPVDGETGKYQIVFQDNYAWHGLGTNEMAAFYPASMLMDGAVGPSSETNLHLKPTQLYETTAGGFQVIRAPMVAYLSASNPDIHDEAGDPNHTLEFKNTCSLIEVNVSGSCVVTRIEVENTGKAESTVTFDDQAVSAMSGRPLWGNFVLDWTSDHQPFVREKEFWIPGNDPALKYITKEITLECEHHGNYGGVEVTGSHPFYIWVPPVRYDKLRVTVYAKHQEGEDWVERCTTLVSNKTENFVANTIYPLSVTYSNSWQPLSWSHDLGPYTVGTYEEEVNGETVTLRRQIEFSFSNLHNDGDNQETDGDAFFFPPYQYDFIGYNDPNNDHDHFLADRLPNISNDPLYGTSQGWFMLSYDQWLYLMGPADAGTEHAHRTDNYRFVNAMVASVPGVILFPDNDYLPTPNTLPTLSIQLTGINKIRQDFLTNEMSLPDFYILENAGCVFLPCVYFTSADINSISDHGLYWTPGTGDEQIIRFELGDRVGQSADDGNGAMVRLVQNYHPATSKKR